MATLRELREKVFTDDQFKNKCEAAAVVGAYEVLRDANPPTPEQIAFADKVVNDPKGYGKKAMMGIASLNRSLSVDQIRALDNGELIAEVKKIAGFFTG